MTTPPRDLTRELYPFLSAGGQSEQSLAAIIDQVKLSTLEKSRETVALRNAMVDEYARDLVDAAAAMASSFARGGKLLAFGNGGSATDAQDAVSDCVSPPVSSWRALPALSLVEDPSIITAIANDVGFDNVFLRQIVAFGTRGDIALAFSTSGNSPSITAALDQARRLGMLTIGISGYDGGAIAASGRCDYCFIARGQHIPRIQEAHATVWHALLELSQSFLGVQ